MATKTISLNIHSFLPLTFGNGPGARACLWLQGCTLNCPGCFNPETHKSSEKLIAIDEIVGWLKSTGNQGLTISGGEPLEQMEGLLKLCSMVRSTTSLSIIVFTGYSYEEAFQLEGFDDLTKNIDVLIAGPFVADTYKPSAFGNNTHKTNYFFSERYSQTDFDATPVSEVIIGTNGELTMTGIDPLRLRQS